MGQQALAILSPAERLIERVTLVRAATHAGLTTKTWSTDGTTLYLTVYRRRRYLGAVVMTADRIWQIDDAIDPAARESLAAIITAVRS